VGDTRRISMSKTYTEIRNRALGRFKEADFVTRRKSEALLNFNVVTILIITVLLIVTIFTFLKRSIL